MFLRQLSYLVALAKEKHFGRAAASCHVSQPALSGAIRNFEAELGVVIVQRGNRFQGFTPDGDRVLTWARKVLADCDALKQEVNSATDDPFGVLRMGAIPASLPLLPMLVQGCLRRFPRIRHQVHTLSSAEILSKLSNFDLDIGLSYLDDERLATFSVLALFRERYVLVAADASMFAGKSVVSWDEVVHLPMGLFTRNLQCRRGIDDAFAAAGVEASPALETDSMTALCAHVRRAGMFSILPHSVLCLDDHASRLAAIPMEPELCRDIGLVYRQEQPGPSLLAAAIRAFRELQLQDWVDGLLSSRSRKP